MKAVGLNTYIWNNNLKSIILLCAFPFLFFLMDFCFFAFQASLNDPTADSVQAGLSGLLHTWHLIVMGVGLWFIIAYFFNGAMIRAATHAQPLSRNEAPEVYNLLENLCISRGISMPALYLMETPALNAFASGIDKKSYSITVTRGLLDRLDKRELQAVLGHELTHILNSDVRLLIISIIFVGILSFLSQIAVRNLVYGRRNRDQGAAVLVGMIILAIGYVLAILIRFALSRRREFMADAGSVALTKDPEAMISALTKISQHAEIEGVPSDVKSMFIENASSFTSLFATHPPIEDRIAALKGYSGM
jgi:heat shock protein HtpX